MKIEIWSDYACPYCYIGEKKLDIALAGLELQSPIQKKFRSFQLNPNAVSQVGVDINTLISNKYGITYEKAKAANDNIVAVAKEVGLNFDFKNIKPCNTELAHQIYKYCESIGKEQQLTKRLFAAYFEQGKDISSEEVLLGMVNELGIDKEVVREVIRQKTYKNAVLNDKITAGKMDINSVPFFLIDDKYTVSGAQSIEHFKMVLNRVINK
jgi:predicted DsbA family dithiol-disulfide isomerase